MSTLTKFSRSAAKVASTTARVHQRGYRAPVRDTRFLVKEVFDFPSHYRDVLKNEEATPEMLDSILDECAKFCENVVGPLNEVADTEGCKLQGPQGPTNIVTPKGFKEAYDQYCEAGWQGISFPEQYGGQGLPLSFGVFRSEMIATANFTWGMFPGLSQGCMNTVIAHGSEALKDKYLPALTEGRWTGTMCLTEPQCGSDLAQVSTKAVPNGDGTYKVSGTKIFISCGDHDMTDNIIHCVLARLPGAPEGTRGISLFLVPKNKVDDEGNVGEFNNVNVNRIENKMGCHGSPTCEIQFEEAEGFLIGTENKGLNHMFTFINTSRLGTAIQGVGAAELAFQKSFPYTLERGSMRSLTGTKNPERKNDPLIVHPDIRKMLLTQKAIAEGGRAMVYECTKIADVMQDAQLRGDKALEAQMDDRLGFLTPILKGFLTEKGLEAANLGIQIWGGHGYIKENGLEQVVRDSRISSVWEGTTGIQSLDLLGRKVMLQKLKPLNENVKQIYKYCWSTATGPHRSELFGYSKQLAKASFKWQKLTLGIASKAMKDKDIVGSASVDYLMYSGYTTMGYMWLRMAEAALKAKANPNREHPVEFYDSKLATAEFYFERIMPLANAHADMMLKPTSTIMAPPAADFEAVYN
eukprot:Awhi_evm1s13840